MNFRAEKKKSKIFWIKLGVFIFLFLVLVIGLVFLNYYLKVRSINVQFFDQAPENKEVQTFTENLIRQKANSLLSYLFLDEDSITKQVHNNSEIVSQVNISKGFGLNLNVNVTKNQEFFYTCADPALGFLVSCMKGNTDGIFYDELQTNATSTNKINIEINPKVLYNNDTLQKVDSPDSLSGTRIYTQEDFIILREILNWIIKNGFIIKKVHVDELKIVDIETDTYAIKVSLDKGYVDTLKDFQLVSKQGNLEKYINSDQRAIDYIDLSYKNKVFFKLKSNTKNDIMSTSTASTTNE